MKYLIIILAILASCKSKPPPQSTVETTTTINKINRLDFVAQDLYATLPNVSFKPIQGTDSLEVVQTTQVVEKVEPEPPEPVPLISLGKKSKGNIINVGSGVVNKQPEKVKTKTVQKEISNRGLVWISIVGVIVLAVLAYFLLRKRI